MKFKSKNRLLISLGITLIAAGIFFLFFNKEEKVRLLIFQTADIHSHIIKKNNIGLYPLAKLIKKETKKCGGLQNRLLFDCGDLFQGTPEGAKTKGETVIPLFNDLHYTAFIPGNHDFDFGRKAFNNNVSKLNCNIIAANLKVRNCPRKIFPWKLYTKKGKKIAVIGMTSPYLKYWLFGKKYEGIKVLPINKALQKIMPAIIAASPDLIILAAHQGLYQAKRYPPGSDLKKIARQFPQIDLILGAHSHQAVPGKIINKKCLFVQPGYHGAFLAKIEVVFNGKSKKIYSELIRPQNIKITEKLKTQQNLNNIKLPNKLKNQLLHFNLNELNNFFVKMIAKIMKKCSNSDLSIYSSRKFNSFKCIKYPVEQLGFKLMPYEDNIVKLHLNGKQLLQIIQEQLNYIRKSERIFCFYNIKFKTNHKGQLISAKFKNSGTYKNISPEKVYSVAFSSYDIAGAGNRFPLLKQYAKLKSSEITDTEILIREALIQHFLNKH